MPFAPQPRLFAHLAPHLPGDPGQQQAAGQQQTDDFQEVVSENREYDAGEGGQADTDNNRAATQVRRQVRGGQADHDRVVSGQHDVDHHDGAERRQKGSVLAFRHQIPATPMVTLKRNRTVPENANGNCDG